ncbi:MAG: 23S rRNA (uracil(1939)-C(5))-methyltransferase RlmD, partial [Cyclobacteriaceae bacterium]|nr:23S rRNA (uracil(1939)-C(5))-methyltransferase RlmD [Cyclobacteriaceae bacterium HetDA_MAG_MS6]
AEDKALTFYDIREKHGLLRNLIIRTTSTGEVMVIVQFGENDAQAIKLVLDLLKKKFPEITALMYIVNQKKNETFYDLPVNTYHGQSFITEKMGDLSFRIGPKSFYQTNSLQAHELYKKVLEYAQLTGRDVVYDLYTGTGTIANFVAKHSKKVVGIESVADAVEDAMENSRLNGISNTSFHAGDMKDMLTDDFVRKHGRPELVITDPPRAGMHKNVVQALINLKPSRIVYVSCNPATQARDLELLGQVYDVKKIQPVDMFPHTHHVECVVSLELRKSMRNFLSNLQN